MKTLQTFLFLTTLLFACSPESPQQESEDFKEAELTQPENKDLRKSREEQEAMEVEKVKDTEFVNFEIFSEPSEEQKLHKEEDFEKFCYQVAEYFENKNIEKINKLLRPEIGIFILWRPGLADGFFHHDKLDLQQPFPFDHYPYSKSEKKYKIKYETLPTYTCQETDIPFKHGTFVDTTKKDNHLTRIMAHKEKYDKIIEPNSRKRLVKEIEKNSRKVVFTDIGRGLIIYVTFIQGNWYLTILDIVTMDCGA